jgi:WD40 repeat protein
VAWHPHQPLVASGGNDQAIRIWHSETGECLKILTGHSSQICCIAWSPATEDNAAILASSSADQTIRLWNIATGDTLHTLHAPRPYEGMNITGATGITNDQRETLIALGAVEHEH